MFTQSITASLLLLLSVADAFTARPLVTNYNSLAHTFAPTQSAPSLFQSVPLYAVNDNDDEDELDMLLEGDDDAATQDVIALDELENADDDVGSQDDGEPPVWAALQQRLDETRAKHRLHETDTGSPEYQVAGMTERIGYLTKHLQANPKDYSTRRGLVALVNKRRRLLNYLSKENVERYKELIASLGVRHKAPGLVTTREDQYGRFPGQKAVKKHLVSSGKGKKK